MRPKTLSRQNFCSAPVKCQKKCSIQTSLKKSKPSESQKVGTVKYASTTTHKKIIPSDYLRSLWTIWLPENLTWALVRSRLRNPLGLNLHNHLTSGCLRCLKRKSLFKGVNHSLAELKTEHQNNKVKPNLPQDVMKASFRCLPLWKLIKSWLKVIHNF